MTTFTIIAYFSMAINIFLIWYIIQLLKRFYILSNNSDDLFQAIRKYKEHLASVYELPMFYGDETLKGLLKHTNDMKEELSYLEWMFNMEEQDEQDEEN